MTLMTGLYTIHKKFVLSCFVWCNTLTMYQYLVRTWETNVSLMYCNVHYLPVHPLWDLVHSMFNLYLFKDNIYSLITLSKCIPFRGLGIKSQVRSPLNFA
jgi:hypothetical protein